MIFGSDRQNKNLKNAASKRIDTTSRTRTSNTMAAKIATSRTHSNSSSVASKSTVASVPRSSLNDGNPDPVRGSMEGYMHAPSTTIMANGTGYDSKSMQTARYKQKTNFKGLDNIGKRFEPFKKYDKITRYSSIVSKNSSANKLNSKLAVERMFK